MKKSNFEFLKGVNDILYRTACAAENNFPDDPNTTLFKLRMFGESAAKHLAKLLCVEPQVTQNDLLRELAKIAWVDDSIIKIFHELRIIGNKAVHDNHDNLTDAEMCLRVTFRLSVWYYRLLTKDEDFQTPLFVLPTSQQSNDDATAQIDELKVALTEAQQQAKQNQQQSKSEVEAQQRKLVDLQGYISILESKQTETVEQTQARIAALEAQLKAKDAEIAKKTEAERKAYKKQITEQAASRSLGLSEPETRYLIDLQLREAGWEANTQTLKYAANTRPEIGRNIAIAEWPTGIDETGKPGFADYVLFVGLMPIAVIEAKKQNLDVMAKLSEAYRYSHTFDQQFLHDEINSHYAGSEQHSMVTEQLGSVYKPSWLDSDGKTRFNIPFCYSANGREYRAAVKTKSGIWHRDVRLSTNQAKALPAWHSPGELTAKLEREDNIRNRWFDENPDLSALSLRYFQEDAVRAVEQGVIAGKQEMMLAMATGTGKTRTAIGIMYRLIQSQRFNRILFLVDRRSLGTQAIGAFEDMRINDETFNSIFNVKGLTDKFPEDSTKIHVATVQSLVKRVLQSDETVPVGRYDCIIVDEAHRGYVLDSEQTEGEEQFRNGQDFISSYRRVIDHFDAIKIALTATPALHTREIFGDPVYRYTYRQAVIDGFLNDQEPPIKITTQLSASGVHFAKGEQVERMTYQGEIVLDELEDEQNFEVADFNRNLIAPNFTKAICDELVNHLDPTGNQKTLVFCVSNDHADMMVEQLRLSFASKYPQLEHDAIIKITGTSDKDPDKIQTMITRYNKERLPNIVVTVDLLSTGVDIPSICNLVFVRKVRSRILYEQMKGRATRLCPQVGKTSFRIFDTVDLYDTLENVDGMKPVVVRPTVDLQTLVNEITDSETYNVKEADGRSFAEHSHDLLVAKLQRVIGQAIFNRQYSKEIDQAVNRFDEICQDNIGCDFANLGKTLKNKGPKWTAEIFNKVDNLVPRIERLKHLINQQRKEPIFTDIADEVIKVEHLYGDYDNPEDFLEAFDKLVDTSVNANAALHTVLTKPRDLTRKGLVELQEWFDSQHFDESTLRKAWAKKTNQDIAARLIGHIRRAAMGQALQPFDERVDHALAKIIAKEAWNEEQLNWLNRLADSIKVSVVLDDNTFKIGNYKRKGGKRKLMNVFNDELPSILSNFSDYIWDEQA
ncbi:MULTISPECIES: type I restriction-modification system endonuclease [unclassified Shewanella]|uniref:type I restriction-modification system endonuclease n=1 Tax=unclassified Shewanella TaxID=196818 RepID=UPI00354DF911